MHKPKITLFDPNIVHHRTAAELFEVVSELPFVCPHTHIDPNLFVDPQTRFTDPATLLVSCDHYILRMLVSQGVPFEQLGVSALGSDAPVCDPRDIWQVFCDHFNCFDGTPSGLWIENSLAMVFGIHEKPNPENAQSLFDAIQSDLMHVDFSPRTLYERFNIEVLCTTDAATDRLMAHQAITTSGWGGQILPTFRADNVFDFTHQGWRDQISRLSEVSGVSIVDYGSFLRALECQRAQFRSLGAVAIDLAASTPLTCWLSPHQAQVIFERTLRGAISSVEAERFNGHMVMEMARMSVEDGLVMQFHVGSYRNHNPDVFAIYGADKGFDIPRQVEWTQNLKPLLDAFGMDPRLRLILFSLDESGYARELAPIAGAYPAVKLGPPWWFFDSPNGMMRYFEGVMETAGIDNTVGFNDDTRAFVTIPARHDLWRRMTALWLSNLVHSGQMDLPTAKRRMVDLCYRLAKKGYRLG
jgi:glucuronate isomerase